MFKTRSGSDMSSTRSVLVRGTLVRTRRYDRIDVKPIDTKQFQSFAKIAGFNQTESTDEEKTDDILKNLVADFNVSIAPNVNAMASMTSALEGLLVLPSFTTKQANDVFDMIDQLVNVSGQVNVADDSLKTVTNKYRTRR